MRGSALRALRTREERDVGRSIVAIGFEVVVWLVHALVSMYKESGIFDFVL